MPIFVQSFSDEVWLAVASEYMHATVVTSVQKLQRTMDSLVKWVDLEEASMCTNGISKSLEKDNYMYLILKFLIGY